MTATSSEKILVVAFDGLDKELIDEFGLENIPQKEYGLIDNYSDTAKIKTSELYASFITGLTYKEHGIKGVKKKNRDHVTKFFEENKTGNWLVENIRGFYRLKTVFKDNFSNEYIPDKDDLQTDTIFEVLEDSRAIAVPGYNPSVFWRQRSWVESLDYLSEKESLEYWKRREHRARKEDLFKELENDVIPVRSLLMCHFQYPDLVQHVYGDKDLDSFNRSELKQMYLEMDELAGEIKAKALEKGYSTIVFMSDHGLPEGDEHNRNAFYSSNKKLFGSETPEITDFAGRLYQISESKNISSDFKVKRLKQGGRLEI